MNYFKFMVSCEWAIPQKKSKQSRVEGVGWGLTFLKKIPEIFRFVTLVCLCHWSFIYSWNSTKLLYALEFPRPKTKTHVMEIPHDFFLISPGLEIPLLFHWPLWNLEFPHSVYLFNTLGNSMHSTPYLPVWIFLEWNNQIN